ncbi:hypothetical protein CKQ80_13520 [Pseudomonas moraviensis]|uniref:Uncharacterized protein n=1 Tax=Pseudomonas moraviensis TaxID=321662 RepID=A0A2A2PLD8_9PSED|nr:hypothetical protein CKQ68_15690 [Pseudomonas moraviensis]PAW56282.1 hypothetical protein CKQ80_13520 [Pseudomonas moraviensis]
MTKGPGRSDCCRVGVTYGYRECLREGRVRVKAATQVRRPSAVRRTCAELCAIQNIDPERPARLFMVQTARENISPCFLATVYRERAPLNCGTSSLQM